MCQSGVSINSWNFLVWYLIQNWASSRTFVPLSLGLCIVCALSRSCLICLKIGSFRWNAFVNLLCHFQSTVLCDTHLVLFDKIVLVFFATVDALVTCTIGAWLVCCMYFQNMVWWSSIHCTTTCGLNLFPCVVLYSHCRLAQLMLLWAQEVEWNSQKILPPQIFIPVKLAVSVSTFWLSFVVSQG